MHACVRHIHEISTLHRQEYNALRASPAAQRGPMGAPRGPMPPRGHFWALWGPKGPSGGTGGLRGSPRSPPEAPGAFLEKPGFWPPGGLPARGKISHRKVSSKGSQTTRDPSRDLRLEKLVPQKIPPPEISIKENSKSRIFFRNPAVWSSAVGGNPATERGHLRREDIYGERASTEIWTDIGVWTDIGCLDWYRVSGLTSDVWTGIGCLD